MTDTQTDLVDVIVEELYKRVEPRFLAIEANLDLLIDQFQRFGERITRLENGQMKASLTPIPKRKS